MQGVYTPLDELSDLDLERVAAGKDDFVSPNSITSDSRSFGFSILGFDFGWTRRTITPGPGVGPGFGYRGWWW